jgi:hypothetical protein
MKIKSWLKQTRSLRHDIYEALLWILVIFLVGFYISY